MDLSIPVLPVRWCRLLPNVDGPGRCRAADAGRDLRPAVTHCITGSTRIVPPGRRPRLLTRFLAVVRPWPGAAVLGLVTLTACWHKLSRRACIRPLTSPLESFLELQAGTAAPAAAEAAVHDRRIAQGGACAAEKALHQGCIPQLRRHLCWQLAWPSEAFDSPRPLCRILILCSFYILSC